MANGEDNNVIRIHPERSSFAHAELHESVARLTVFYWLALLYAGQLGLFALLCLLGQAAAADKLLDVANKFPPILFAAAGYFISERRTGKR